VGALFFSQPDHFVPTDLGSSIVLWLRSDLGVTLSAGNVSGWADQSGYGNSASQGTGANQPPFITNAINGRPVVRLNNAATTFLTIANAANLNFGVGSWDVFVVGTARAGGAFVVVLGKTNATDANNLRWFVQSNNDPVTFWGTDVQSYATGSTTITVNTPTLVEWGLDATNSVLRYAGGGTVQTQASGAISGTGNGTDALEIGGNPGNTNYQAQWDIAEIVMMNRYALADERARLTSYFKSMYGAGVSA
jgi:hypothetical protein